MPLHQQMPRGGGERRPPYNNNGNISDGLKEGPGPSTLAPCPPTPAPRYHGPVEHDTKRIWQEISKRDVLPSKQLLFIHLEKSAGGGIEHIMDQVMPQESLITYHQAGVPALKPPEDYFVVSSIRNPCDQYVSQWSYACEKTFLTRYDQHDNSAVMKSLEEQGGCPKFILKGERGHYRGIVQDKNVQGFQNWLPNNFWYKEQFEAVFEDPAMKCQTIQKERVNCWVKFEDLWKTLYQCLKEYERSSDYRVNWIKFKKMLDAENRSRNSAHPNDSPHTHCSEYYHPDLRNRVHKAHASLFSYFGYDNCCEPI